MTPEQLGTIGVNVSATLATLSMIGLVSLARFWRSRGGWFVFWDLMMVTWILDMIVVVDLFGDSPWFMWLRVGAFAVGFPLVLGWRLWIILDLQLRSRYRKYVAYREGRHPDEEEEHAA